jgi:hypothetical protein
VSNPQHVQLALEALAPAGRTFFEGQAPGTASPPWLVGSLDMPRSILHFASGSHGGVATWWVTAVGSTAAQARVIAHEAVLAWSGARISPTGYVVSALSHRYSNGPYAAGLNATDTNLRFQVVRLGFDLTLSATA